MLEQHLVTLKGVRLANQQLIGNRTDHQYGATFLLDRFVNKLDLDILDKVVRSLYKPGNSIHIPDAGVYEFGTYIHLKAYRTTKPKYYDRDYTEADNIEFYNGCIVDAEFEFTYDDYLDRIDARLISVRFIRDGEKI